MPDASADATILVVDDDEAILEVVADVLRFEGYPVATAIDGAEALDAVERQRPALVLLDMRMPRVDGWAFARAVAARGIELRILVMTAARDAAGWAEEIGAQGYLAKPFDIGELLEAVRSQTGAA